MNSKTRKTLSTLRYKSVLVIYSILQLKWFQPTGVEYFREFADCTTDGKSLYSLHVCKYKHSEA